MSQLPDVYDDRPLRGPRPPRQWPGWVASALALIALAAAGWFFLRRQDRAQPVAPVHVARPATPPASQTAAMRLLRQRLRETMRDDCLAIIGNGSDARGYLFTAVDRCANKPLGRWRVDRKTGAVAAR